MAAIVVVGQARPPQWQPHYECATISDTTFYFAKSRQDSGQGGVASGSGPVETNLFGF